MSDVVDEPENQKVDFEAYAKDPNFHILKAHELLDTILPRSRVQLEIRIKQLIEEYRKSGHIVDQFGEFKAVVRRVLRTVMDD